MTEPSDKPPIGIWYKCVGCGAPIGFFPNGYPPHLPPGACAHAKPKELLGRPNSVPCALYRRSEPEELWALHQGAERIESPESFTPVTN